MDYKLVIIMFVTVAVTFWWVMKGIFHLIPKQDLKLLHILFPSWKFFEDLTPIPKIFYRVSQNGNNYSEWLPLNQNKPQRSIRKLFHNPEENLQLTYQAQIEQLVNDIAELPSSNYVLALESLTSYKIVSAYIKEQILLSHTTPYFQFKIGALEFHSHQPPVWSEILYSNDCELL